MKFGRRRAYAALTAAAMVLGMVAANAGAASRHAEANTLVVEWALAPGVVEPGGAASTVGAGSVATVRVSGASAGDQVRFYGAENGTQVRPLDITNGNVNSNNDHTGVPHVNDDAAFADSDTTPGHVHVAFFSVQVGTPGLLHFHVEERTADGSANVTPLFDTEITAVDGPGLATNSTVTRSVGRISLENGTATVVVQALNADKDPVPGQQVMLAATNANPEPSSDALFGSGFYGPSESAPIITSPGILDTHGDPVVDPTATTDQHGVAVFTVAGNHIRGVAYFTPVFVNDIESAAQQSTAIIFSKLAPSQEAFSSFVGLSDPGNEGAPTEENMPADGTTSAVVYVHLRCACQAGQGWLYTGDDLGNGYVGMPTATVDASQPYTAIRGSVLSVNPTSNGAHATIRPLSEVGAHGAQSQDELGPDEAWSDRNGVAAFLVTDNVAEDVTLQAYDVSNNLVITGGVGGHENGSVTVHFLPVSPDKTTTTVTAAPAVVPADGTSASTVTVTVRGLTRQPIAGRTVVLSSTSVTASLQSSSVVTDINGVAKFSVSNSHAEDTTFTATDSRGGMLGSIKVTFTPAAPSAANSTITVTTTPLHADGSMSGSVKIHLADNAGNPDACLPIFLDQANAHSTVTALPVPTAMQAEGCMDADGNSLYLADDDHQVHTDKNGDAEFTATDTVAEDVLFTAHIGTFLLPATDPMHFIAGVWDAQNSSTELDLASAPADGKTKATVTVTLRDAHQNPLSGTAVTLTPTGSSTAVITPGATLTTQSDGTAVFTVADNTAHAITLTATDAAGTVIGQVLNLAFTGHAIPACTTPDPLKCSQVSADTFHAPVGSLITVHATVRDQVGSAISGEHLSISTFGGTVYQAGESSGNATDATGTAGFIIGSSSPGVVEVHVLDGLLTLDTIKVTFFGDPAADLTTIDAASPFVPVGTDTQITVTVRDSEGFLVSGQHVTLTGNPSGSTISPADVTSDEVTGQAIFTVSNTAEGPVTFTAHIGNIDSRGVTIQFVEADTESSMSTMGLVVTDPMYADGIDKATVTVTLKDGSGIEIPNHAVTLECKTKIELGDDPNKPIHDATETEVTATTTPTPTAGQHVFDVTTLDPDKYECVATDTDGATPIFARVSPTFSLTPTEANRSLITASARTVPTGETATITVALKDAADAAIPTHEVTLTAKVNNDAPITVGTKITDANGLASFEVSRHDPASVTYAATDTTATPNVPLTNTVVVSFSDEKASSTVSVTPNLVPADGQSTAAVIVTLMENGNPVSGHRVVLLPRNGASDIVVQTNPTGDDGIATFLVSDALPEVVTYDVADDDIGLTLAATPQVAFTSPDRPLPHIATMTPTTGGTHTEVTITGTGLSGAVVDFGSVPAETLSIDAQGKTIVATAPHGSGTVVVTVLTPGGATTAGNFTYDPSLMSKKARAAKHGGHPVVGHAKAVRREGTR